MATELQTVIAISEKPSDIAGNAFEVNGTPHAGLQGWTFINWIDEILANTTGNIDFLNHEFLEFNLGESLKIIDQDLADMLGLIYNTVYPSSLFFSPNWGNRRLVLQNAANATGVNSVLGSFDEIAVDFNNETTILRGFAPIANYEEDNDREAYKAEVRFFPAARRDDVKIFLETNGKGLAEDLYIFGLEYKVDTDVIFNLNLKDYSGITDQHSFKDLKQWDIGFIMGV